MELIDSDKKGAAETYLKLSREKTPVADIVAMLNDPQIVLTMTPQNTLKYAEFMNKVGSIKRKPSSWKELFFPEIHALPGS